MFQDSVTGERDSWAGLILIKVSGYRSQPSSRNMTRKWDRRWTENQSRPFHHGSGWMLVAKLRNLKRLSQIKLEELQYMNTSLGKNQNNFQHSPR